MNPTTADIRRLEVFSGGVCLESSAAARYARGSPATSSRHSRFRGRRLQWRGAGTVADKSWLNSLDDGMESDGMCWRIA